MNNQDPSLQSPQEANTGKHVDLRETGEARASGNESLTEDEESPVQKQWREMREEERMKPHTDPSLETPQDANTQKHIDFVGTEEEGNESESLRGEDEETPVQKQWREMREEKIKDDTDPSLQSPQDANTQKHIDFFDTE